LIFWVDCMYVVAHAECAHIHLERFDILG